ncbi:MAG: hypothetical protein J2P36_38150 [Ktedonobacteraceae bacterium]|nr:hypothetical protein [Ktedonobacteraceae bacterium]
MQKHEIGLEKAYPEIVGGKGRLSGWELLLRPPDRVAVDASDSSQTA